MIQDGTPALRLLEVTERLAESFDNYVVALQHKVAWPLPSPALTPCDFFVEFFRHTTGIIDLCQIIYLVFEKMFSPVYRKWWKT